MKTLKSLLYALIASFVLMGCNKEADFSAGGIEDPNCYKVFFPSQETAGNQELDPAAETKLTFIVRREKTEGEIVVPLTIKSATASIFTIANPKFENGADEATFDVIFPDAEVGSTYDCEISINDPKYAAIYGTTPVGISFSVTRVKWNQVVGVNGEELGSWKDVSAGAPFGKPEVTGQCKVYERDDRKGYYRFENPYNKGLVDGLFGTGAYEALAWPADVIVVATAKDEVYIPVQEIGLSVNKGSPTEYGSIRLASKVKANFPSTSPELFGKLEEGVITFPVSSILMSMALYEGGAYVFANDANLVLTLPGAKVFDYSLKLTGSESKDGVVAIAATLGKDVAKGEYAFFNGSLSAAQAENFSNEMATGETPVKEITATSTINAIMEETAVYTIILNARDEKGLVRGYKALVFGYVKAGEEVPVVLTYGLDITNEFAAQGLTRENSVKIYANGSEIKSAMYGLFEKSNVAADADLGALVKKSGKAFTAEQLAKINGTGYSGVIGGLNGGTEYLLVISAFNGYVTKAFSAKATTDGTPHPLKRTYSIADFAGKFSKPELFKTWKIWGIDKDDEVKTDRQYLGDVVISENTANDAADLDAINLKGLTLGNSAVEDTIYWEYDAENGAIWTLKMQPMGYLMAGANKYYLGNAYANAAGTGSDAMDYMMIGIKVEDGYMAFVCNPNYAAQYNFNAMLINAYKDAALTDKAGYWTWTSDIMFEDPAVATSSTPASAVKRSDLPRIAREVLTVPSNFVELRDKARLSAILKDARENAANRASAITEVAMPSLGVAKAQVSVTQGVVAPEIVGELTITAQPIVR